MNKLERQISRDTMKSGSSFGDETLKDVKKLIGMEIKVMKD